MQLKSLNVNEETETVNLSFKGTDFFVVDDNLVISTTRKDMVDLYSSLDFFITKDSGEE